MKKSTFGLLATAAMLLTPVAAFAQDYQENLQINHSAGSASGYGNFVNQNTTQNNNVPIPVHQGGGTGYGDASGGDGSGTPHEVDNYYDPSYGGASATTDSDGNTYFSVPGLSINSGDPNW